MSKGFDQRCWESDIANLCKRIDEATIDGADPRFLLEELRLLKMKRAERKKVEVSN